MVNYEQDSLSATFSALADPTRRAILARLSKGEATVGELAQPFEMSLPAVSKHLGVLEGAGLVRRRRDGRLKRCEMNTKPMAAAAAWINFYRQFWEGQFEALDRYLRKAPSNPTNDSRASIPGKGTGHDGDTGT